MSDKFEKRLREAFKRPVSMSPLIHGGQDIAKRNFMVEYVLTRAAAAGGGHFDGKSSAEKAAKAWAVIEKECGGAA